MPRRGPKPPLDGKALLLALDCAILANSPDVSPRRERPAIGPRRPPVEIPRDTYQALAARFVSRTFPAPLRVRASNAAITAGLSDLQRVMRREIVPRIGHPGGFEVDGGAVVKVVDGLQTEKRDGRPYVVEKRSPVVFFAKGDPGKRVAFAEPLHSKNAKVAIVFLLVAARYSPFERCGYATCGMIFVPQKAGQRFCSVRCRKADHHRRATDPRTPDGRRRRKAAARRAADHRRGTAPRSHVRAATKRSTPKEDK